MAALCTIFTIPLTFFGKSCNAHMLHASGMYYSLILNSRRSYVTFATKIPIFREFWVCFVYKMAKIMDLQKCQ